MFLSGEKIGYVTTTMGQTLTERRQHAAVPELIWDWLANLSLSLTRAGRYSLAA